MSVAEPIDDVTEVLMCRMHEIFTMHLEASGLCSYNLEIKVTWVHDHTSF